MGRKRNGLKAAVVYEVPVTGLSDASLLRVRAVDAEAVLVEIPVTGCDPVELTLAADAWRALCDLRNVVLPRRRERKAAAQPEPPAAAPNNGEATA